jgi:phosphate transport system ATP-binding protein
MTKRSKPKATQAEGGRQEDGRSSTSTISELRTENLELFYNERRAFHPVNHSFGMKSITALVGPSGCGKTSFLNCLNRMSDFIPGVRVEGKVFLDGDEVHQPSVDLIHLRRRVGMIFQRPTPFPLSIRRNIEFPLHEHGIKGSEASGIMESALRDVGLWNEVKDRLNGPAGNLSGGQQQRLCIARALSLKPEVLLMDEPCSALDPISSGMVEDLILSLRGRYTILVVTHNLAQARRIAEDVLFFWIQEDAGKMVESGKAREFFENPKSELARLYVSGARG